MEETTELLIKNMVCPRCIRVIKEDMEKLGLEVVSIRLGNVTVRPLSGSVAISAIKASLEREGFELLEDKQALIVENIKKVTISRIYSGDIENSKSKFSEYISEAVGKDYHYLSTVFSSVEHMTIEKYFILQKIERAKELLSYNELSASEIARKLGYSSSPHFSTQFKQVTGMPPSKYRKDTFYARKFIDQVK